MAVSQPYLDLAARARHQAVLWAKHGTNGDADAGLTADEIRALCAYHGVQQSVF